MTTWDEEIKKISAKMKAMNLILNSSHCIDSYKVFIILSNDLDLVEFREKIPTEVSVEFERECGNNFNLTLEYCSELRKLLNLPTPEISKATSETFTPKSIKEGFDIS